MPGTVYMFKLQLTSCTGICTRSMTLSTSFSCLCWRKCIEWDTGNQLKENSS